MALVHKPSSQAEGEMTQGAQLWQANGPPKGNQTKNDTQSTLSDVYWSSWGGGAVVAHDWPI